MITLEIQKSAVTWGSLKNPMRFIQGHHLDVSVERVLRSGTVPKVFATIMLQKRTHCALCTTVVEWIVGFYKHLKLGLIFGVGLVLQTSRKITIGLIFGVGLFFGETLCILIISAPEI